MGGTTSRNSITPMFTCRSNKMTVILITTDKTGRWRTCQQCPCSHHITYSLTTSLLILYIGGWNHSDLEFSISFRDLLISTPSLICLLMLSLFVLVTFALYLLVLPGWHCSICLRAKQDSFFSLPSVLSPFTCSL